MEETKQESMTNGKKKREDKIRRRDNRALENILRTINPLMEGEKFQIMKDKYSELYEEHRNLQNNLSLFEKKTTVLQREKDQLQSEHSKSVLARSRLENLCREFQRQNKLIKEENIAKIREEEELRKEVVAKFQTSLNEFTNMMQENSEKNLKLKDDNLDMASKIASLCQQFEKGEDELARISKQMCLEKQLCEATVAKLQFELKAEREIWNKEREVLKKKLQESEITCTQLQNNITALETHLQMYTGKYEEFETTISKSNEVFDNCKSEMVKMTKQINSLERELKTWKSRWEKKAKAVNEITASKQAQELELGRKIEQLQKLCRQLQVDRAAYLKLLKSNGIEPSSQICIDSTPPQPAATTPVHKPTKKEQELELLKNNLKVLKEQFAGLINTNGGKEEGSTESSEDITIENTEDANQENVEDIMIETSEESKLESNEESKVENNEETKIEIIEGSKIENSEETKIVNSEEPKIENSGNTNKEVIEGQSEETKIEIVEKSKPEVREESKSETTETKVEEIKPEVSEKSPEKTSEAIDNKSIAEATATPESTNL